MANGLELRLCLCVAMTGCGCAGCDYFLFDSKEALLLDLLQHLEADFQRKVLDEVLRPELGPRESLRIMLRIAVAARSTEPLLRNLSDADAQLLMRRIPPDQAVALREADVASARRFVDYWCEQGVPPGIDADVLTGLMRAVVLTAFRQSEIGPAVYEQVMQLMIDSIAQQVMPTHDRSEQRQAHVA